MPELSVEWCEADEPYRAVARLVVHDGDRVLATIERITREQIGALAADFAATEADMRWHEARWIEASGFQRAFGHRAKEHLVAACDDPVRARALCGIRPVGLVDRASWYRVWPLIGEPRKGLDRCARCWCRYTEAAARTEEATRA